MYRVALLYSALLVLLTPLQSFAKDASKITVAVSEIPSLLSENADAQGSYNQILTQLSNDIDVIFMPPARLEVEFPAKKYVECIFPASLQTIISQTPLIASDPVEKVSAFVFSKNGLTMDNITPETKIAIRRGFTMGHVRKKLSATYIELNSDLETAQFLSLGRVDAVIAYLPDFVGAHEELSLPIPVYAKDSPVYEAVDSFVCRRSPKTESFLQNANKVIKAYRQTAQ